MKRVALITTFLFLALALPAQAEPPAKYTVTFDGTWSKESHPLDFPFLAHFSGLIGATHNDGYAIFVEDGTATDGLEHLCEMGKHSPLDAEITKAVQAGTAGVLFEAKDPIRPVPGKASVTFPIDEKHPMVSLVAMIAPSPDWFAGVSNVNLLENGQWLKEKTLTLYAWDGGTDDGTSYRSLDKDRRPKGKVQKNGSAHFLKDAQPIPVGTVTFVKQ